MVVLRRMVAYGYSNHSNTFGCEIRHVLQRLQPLLVIIPSKSATIIDGGSQYPIELPRAPTEE
jgi:hypothetical protein